MRNERWISLSGGPPSVPSRPILDHAQRCYCPVAHALVRAASTLVSTPGGASAVGGVSQSWLRARFPAGSAGRSPAALYPGVDLDTSLCGADALVRALALTIKIGR